MDRLLKSRDYLMKCLGFVLLFGFISLGAIGGCNTDNGTSSGLTVRQIGELNSVLADGIAAQVRLIPFEAGSDTPIILEGETIFTLNDEEKEALRKTYDAGLAIVLLDAEEPAIEEFLEIIDDGISWMSGTHDILLAYIARNVGHYTARLVSEPPPSDHLIDHTDDILASAVTIIVSELGTPPPELTDIVSLPPGSPGPIQQVAGTTADLQSFPVVTQTFSIPLGILNGAFNTTISIYAAHACETGSDHYVVNAVADWTPASFFMVVNTQSMNWLPTVEIGGFPASAGQNNVCPNHADGGDDNTGCSFSDYPTFYRVEMEPLSSEGMVTQTESAPAGTQGTSTSYQSGISFSIGGRVSITGTPALTAGVTWSNIKTVIVPAIKTLAGNLDNEGSFWQFQYCPGGDCSTGFIGTANPSSLCQDQLGAPENGQTVNGKFSDAAQTVHWTAIPDGEPTFEIKVTFLAPIVETEMRVWDASFDAGDGVGTCNSCFFGCCDCQAVTRSEGTFTQDAIFAVPIPTRDCD